MGRRLRSAVGLGLGLLWGLGIPGCAHWPGARAFNYFERPDPRDPWSPKIAFWQSRERTQAADLLRGPASVSGSRGRSALHRVRSDEDLRAKYLAFRAQRKRAMAREVATWIQTEARVHYRPDGPVDHWATLEETLARNGDDCDGLELLVFHFLRDLGFPEDEVFRAIVYRPDDGQHHMVTLWFEDRDDPWVIDPTGAMVSGMPRMSEVPGWVPLKVFSDTREYTAQERAVSPPARSASGPGPHARAVVGPR